MKTKILVFLSALLVAPPAFAGPWDDIVKYGYAVSGGPLTGAMGFAVCEQVDDDTTPSIGTPPASLPTGCNVLLTSTNHSGPITITRFDDAESGIEPVTSGLYEQILWVVGRAATNQTTIADGANFRLKEIPWDSPATGDHSVIQFKATYTTGAITSIADGGGGTSLDITSTAHGLVVSQTVTLSSMSVVAYDGTYVINTVADPNTFNVTAAYSATATGTWDAVRFDEMWRSGNVDDYLYQQLFVSYGNITDFPNTQVVVGQADTGAASTDRIALVVEATADGSNDGVAIRGYAVTSSAEEASAGIFEATVSAGTDTTTAYGTKHISTDTHGSGPNVGAWCNAANGSVSYCFELQAGDIHSVASVNWLGVDNTNPMVSWDAAGAANIMAISSADGEETVAVAAKSTFTCSNDAATGDEYCSDIVWTTDKASSGDSYGIRMRHTATAVPAGAYPIDIGHATASWLTLDGAGNLTLNSGAAAAQTTSFQYNSTPSGQIQAWSADLFVMSLGTHALQMLTETVTGTSNSASIYMLTGNQGNAGDYDTGDATTATGNTTTLGDSGDVESHSGNAADSSGTASMYSGTSANAGEASGDVSTYSGNQTHATGGASGNNTRITGDVAGTAQSGDLVTYSGAQTNAGDVASGGMAWSTGATTTDGDPGSFLFTTGVAGAGVADAGSFTVQTHGANDRFTIAGNGTATFTGAVDAESYMSIGNGTALSSNITLVIDRDFSDATSGEALSVTGSQIEVTAGTGDIIHTMINPGETKFSTAATVHGYGLSMNILEPNIVLADGATVTHAATVRIVSGPSEGVTSNWAFWVDADDVQIDENLTVDGTITAGALLMAGNLDMDGYNVLMDTDGDTGFINDRDADVADDEIDVQINSAVDFTFAANRLNLNETPSSDTAADDTALIGANAWSQASAGANRNGSDVNVSSGVRTFQIVCNNFAWATGDIVGFTVDGVLTNLTEGAQFNVGGDDETTCDNLGTAITTAVATIKMVPDCDTTAGTCYLQPNEDVLAVDSITFTDGGVDGVFATLTEGTDGSVTIHTAYNALVVGPTSITLDDLVPTAGALDLTGSFTATGDVTTTNVHFGAASRAKCTSSADNLLECTNAAGQGIREDYTTDGVLNLYDEAGGALVVGANTFQNTLVGATATFGSVATATAAATGDASFGSGPAQNAGDFVSGNVSLTSGPTTTDGDTGNVTVGPGTAGAGQADSGDLYLQVHGATWATLEGSSGDFMLDNPGTNVDSPSLHFKGDSTAAGGAGEVEASIRMAFGAQPYFIFAVDDDHATPVLTDVMHLDDVGLRPATAGLLTLGDSTLYFGAITGQSLAVMDTANDNTITISAAGDEAGDRALTLTMGGDRSLSIEGATVLDQDYSSDAAVQFGSMTLAGAAAGSLTMDDTTTGADADSPTIVLRGNNWDAAADSQADASIYMVVGNDPYIRISVDDNLTAGAAGVLTAVLDIHDTVIGNSTPGLTTLGSVTNYFSSVATQAQNIMDAGNDHYLTVAWNEDNGVNAQLRYIFGGDHDHTITYDADLTVEGAATVDQDLTVDAIPTWLGAIWTPDGTQSLLAATAITDDNKYIPVVGNGGAVVLTGTPTITAGSPGQEICLIGTSDANTVKLQDEAQLAGTTLELAGSVDFILGIHDTICLVFYNSHWAETTRSDNDDD